MEYLEIPAPSAWRDWIHCVWCLRGNSGEGTTPVVPDGRAEIVIHLGDPFSVIDSSGRARSQADVMVSGQLTRPLDLIPSTTPAVAGIRLTTAGAGAILPIAELADRVIPLADVRPALGAALLDAFAGRPLTPESLLCAALVVADTATRAPSYLARTVVQRLESSSPPRLRSLAAELGVTPRTLQRRVRAEIGTSSVMLRRLIRFRRAFRMLSGPTRGRFAHAAISAGYFDQAHLIRDFRRFAGRPPRGFFQSEADLAIALLGADPS